MRPERGLLPYLLPCLLALSWLSGAVAAELPLMEPRPQGRFEQSRAVAWLPQPLLSRGQYQLHQGEELDWVVTEPGYHALRIAADGLRERNAPEAAWSEPRLGGAGAEMMGRMLRALLSADQQALEAFFEAQAEPIEDGWRVRLLPRLPALAERLQAVELHAQGELLQSIHWWDAEGALTRIRLLPLEGTPEPKAP